MKPHRGQIFEVTVWIVSVSAHQIVTGVQTRLAEMLHEG